MIKMAFRAMDEFTTEVNVNRGKRRSRLSLEALQCLEIVQREKANA